MPKHPWKSHTEATQPTSESTEWPRYKLQERNSMEIKQKIACKRDKRETHLIIGGQFPNGWAKMKGTAP